MPAGTVSALWRWPVKSMAGERAPILALDRRSGARGDRAHALWYEHKGRRRTLTAEEAPRLLAWAGSYGDADPGDVPEATVTAPGGDRFAWSDPALAGRLASDLGCAVELRRHPTGQQYLKASLLVTVEASRRALEAELGEPLDVRRFRPNLHLDLDAAPYVEEGWEGSRLELGGGAVLRFIEPCERCVVPTRDPDTQARWPALARHLYRAHGNRFGINARVEVPGPVREGATARVDQRQ